MMNMHIFVGDHNIHSFLLNVFTILLNSCLNRILLQVIFKTNYCGATFSSHHASACQLVYPAL